MIPELSTRNILVYMGFHVVTYILIVYVLAKGHLKNKNNTELNKKYAPFVRNDLDKWSIIWNFPFYITFWPRIFVAFLLAVSCPIWINLCMIGVDTKNPVIGPWRKWLIKEIIKFHSGVLLLMGGLVWYNIERVSTGEGDYRKWLGPDWKPEWEGSGTIVSNHVCWFDIILMQHLYVYSFVCKASVRNYFGIGKCAIATDCLFLGAAGTREEKIAVGKSIESRQAENEKYGRSPLVIFPEGATTNNESVIKFKRGPFSGLSSVQPLGVKYWSLNGISP